MFPVGARVFWAGQVGQLGLRFYFDRPCSTEKVPPNAYRGRSAPCPAFQQEAKGYINVPVIYSLLPAWRKQSIGARLDPGVLAAQQAALGAPKDVQQLLRDNVHHLPPRRHEH